jgi:hypothetical protein
LISVLYEHYRVVDESAVALCGLVKVECVPSNGEVLDKEKAGHLVRRKVFLPVCGDKSYRLRDTLLHGAVSVAISAAA